MVSEADRVDSAVRRLELARAAGWNRAESGSKVEFLADSAVLADFAGTLPVANLNFVIVIEVRPIVGWTEPADNPPFDSGAATALADSVLVVTMVVDCSDCHRGE